MSLHPSMSIQLLGGFQVALDGEVVSPSVWLQRKPAALIKLLALAPSHRLHREIVCDTLWPDLEPNAATNNLRGTLMRARRELSSALDGALPGDFLQRNGDILTLGPVDRVHVDVVAFESAVALAWRSPLLDHLRAAIDHYRGDLLPEDPYEDWVADRRVALRTAYLTLLQRLVDSYESRTELAAAVEVLERLVMEEPTSEEATVRLMRLYVRRGHRKRALLLYKRLVEVLQRDLDCEPDLATQNVASDIQAGQLLSISPNNTTASTTLEQDRSDQANAGIRTLPSPVDELIGRDRELAEIRQLIATARLVTLTGPGGIGKTRLAIHIGTELSHTLSGAVAFVDLSAVSDPSLVLAVLVEQLGVSTRNNSDLSEALRERLSADVALLILDNLEQIANASAEISSLLIECPRLRLLTTSRVRLRMRGEHVFQVPPMRLPDQNERGGVTAIANTPAVRLFIERAHQATPNFAVTESTMATLTEICNRLEGVPLAIELAAARMRILQPTDLLKHLDSAHTLTVLAEGPRDAPERQRTIRGTIAWSYDLLSVAEQRLFRRLAVFAGGWTFSAAEAVVNFDGQLGVTVMDGLSTLLDANLVLRRETNTVNQRFGFLQTVREFALERAREDGDFAKLRDPFATYILTFARRAHQALAQAEDQQHWLEQLDRERINVRSALEWLTPSTEALHANENPDLATSAVLSVELSALLWRYWETRGQLREGRDWIERALTAAKVYAPDALPSSVHSLALNNFANLVSDLGDYAQAAELYHHALTLRQSSGDLNGSADTLNNLGLLAELQGDSVTGAAFLNESLALRLRANPPGETLGEALTLNNLGDLALHQGDAETARPYFLRALRIQQRRGDLRQQGFCQSNLGEVHLVASQFPLAIERLQAALRLFEQIDDLPGKALVHHNLAEANFALGDLHQSTQLSVESLTIRYNLGDRRGVFDSLTHLAKVAYLCHQFPLAVTLDAAAEHQRTRFRIVQRPRIATATEERMTALRNQLSADAFLSAWKMGSQPLPTVMNALPRLVEAAAIFSQPDA